MRTRGWPPRPPCRWHTQGAGAERELTDLSTQSSGADHTLGRSSSTANSPWLLVPRPQLNVNQKGFVGPVLGSLSEHRTELPSLPY